jgi:hypothetical protein
MASASDAVRREWHLRIEAEYRSAALTAELNHWLIQAGAPPDLIEGGLRIVKDELAHAELSHAVFVDAGGSASPTIDRQRLELARDRKAPLEHAILRCGVELFCLGETVAVRLFQRMREQCTAPSARNALDRIVRDEVFHRDFGWTLLEWLLSGAFENDARALLGRELAGMLMRLRRGYGGVALERSRAALESEARLFSDADRAWGLIPVLEYVSVVEETLERDYRPRFAELGISLSSEATADEAAAHAGADGRGKGEPADGR